MNQIITILLIIILILFITRQTQIENFNPHPVFKYEEKLFLSGKNDHLIVTKVKPTDNFQIFELSNRRLFQMKFNDKYIMPIYNRNRSKYIPVAKNATYDPKRNDEYIVKYDKMKSILYYELPSNNSTTKKVKHYFVVDKKTDTIYLDGNINKASKFMLSYD